MARAGEVVLPGDEINMDVEDLDNSSSIIIGPGLRQNLGTVIATKPGVLRFRQPAVYWIDCHQKRVLIANTIPNPNYKRSRFH